jgi:hypothetical protein
VEGGAAGLKAKSQFRTGVEGKWLPAEGKLKAKVKANFKL